jgi:DNA-binding response OmpR family regulator/signal transduction histidine kinase
VAIVLGQLVARIRAQEQAERRREERALALYQLTRELAQAGTRDEVVWQLMLEVGHAFSAPVAVALPGARSLVAHPDSSLALTEKELTVAEWARQHRQAAGRFTDNLPGAEALHLPLATERSVLGVLAVGLPGRTLTLAQRDLLEAYARQAALVLDRVALRAAAEQSQLVAESERLSNALLDSISHELRTPLAVITSATSTLAESKDAPAGLQRAMIAEIQEATTRLNRLVGNLLDVTRLASGHVRAALDWCDVGDLIQATVRLLGRELAGRPVTIDAAAKLPLARLDFTLMQQALSNLLLNAVVHTPPGTPVCLQVRREPGCLALSVADNGPGLPPELLPRIFDKFPRAPGAPAGGSGLGLAIVKGFVEAQSGRITVENRPGGGAVFTIRVPQTEPADMSEPTANPATVALVIDDEPQIRRLLRVTLEANGYRVFDAATGQEGIVQAAQRQPEVILLDLGLPDLDGVSVLKRLREWCQVPVIILTVRDREADKIAALDHGADDYVTKPFSTGELLARLRVALRRAQPTPDTAVFRSGPLEVDLAARVVTVNGKEAKLTATEYSLLRLFVRHAGKVLTHRQLLREVWGESYVEQTHYLRVYMAHLRDKLEADPAQPKLFITDPGVGYRLIEQE